MMKLSSLDIPCTIVMKFTKGGIKDVDQAKILKRKENSTLQWPEFRVDIVRYMGRGTCINLLTDNSKKL